MLYGLSPYDSNLQCPNSCSVQKAYVVKCQRRGQLAEEISFQCAKLNTFSMSVWHEPARGSGDMLHQEIELVWKIKIKQVDIMLFTSNKQAVTTKIAIISFCFVVIHTELSSYSVTFSVFHNSGNSIILLSSCLHCQELTPCYTYGLLVSAVFVCVSVCTCVRELAHASVGVTRGLTTCQLVVWLMAATLAVW